MTFSRTSYFISSSCFRHQLVSAFDLCKNSRIYPTLCGLCSFCGRVKRLPNIHERCRPYAKLQQDESETEQNVLNTEGEYVSIIWNLAVPFKISAQKSN